MFALTAIKGVGRRYSNIVLKKADVDLDKRAGECSEEEVEKIITIMSNPRQYKIPDWFLNRQKDIVDGKYNQVSLNFSQGWRCMKIQQNCRSLTGDNCFVFFKVAPYFFTLKAQLKRHSFTYQCSFLLVACAK